MDAVGESEVKRRLAVDLLVGNRDNALIGGDMSLYVIYRINVSGRNCDAVKAVGILCLLYTEQILKAEIGATFQRVLEYAGVYKRTDDGKAAFLRFIDNVNA